MVTMANKEVRSTGMNASQGWRGWMWFYLLIEPELKSLDSQKKLKFSVTWQQEAVLQRNQDCYWSLLFIRLQKQPVKLGLEGHLHRQIDCLKKENLLDTLHEKENCCEVSYCISCVFTCHQHFAEVLKFPPVVFKDAQGGKNKKMNSVGVNAPRQQERRI